MIYDITIAFPMFGETGQIIFRHIGDGLVYKLIVSTALVFSTKTLFIRLYRGLEVVELISKWLYRLDVIVLLSVKVSVENKQHYLSWIAVT